MRISFDAALSITQSIAQAKVTEVVALSYSPYGDQFTAYFGNAEDETSYVLINPDLSFTGHLVEYDAHFGKSEESEDE